MNSYHEFVSAFANLITNGKTLPLGHVPPHDKPASPAAMPVALIFSPHPDDECIIGGLALRLMREGGMRVINVAVTLGSKKERQAGRLRELKNACDWIGFGLEQTATNGLEGINPKTRSTDPQRWAGAVETIANILIKYQPRILFFPHELDWNSTHIGTHHLVMDALKELSPGLTCFLVETEFWGQMATPNLMVESSTEDVADLIAALSFHVEEVRRNPYHLRLPAWMQDNVRRGAELVGGQGGAAPDFLFATLYRVRQWKNGLVEEVWTGGKLIGAKDNPAEAFRSPQQANLN